MASDPSDFVLKAYKTEQNALDDTNRLKVKSSTDVHITNKEQDASYNFFTHEKYYFRIESNAPVKEFYIDWDDGENSDPNDGANYTVIKLNPPGMVGITSHIFTRDKVHFPKIRVKDSNGFLSKFYMPDRHSSDWNGTHIKGIDILTANDVADADVFAVPNNHYKFRVDSSSSAGARIPKFAPTPKPPVAVLKADKKRVFAGITNKYLAGTDGTHAGKTVQLIGSHSSMDTSRTGVKVRVTAHIETADDNSLTNTGSGELVVNEITCNTSGTNTIDNVLKVVKMELVQNLEATDDITSASTTDRLFPGEKLILCVNDGTNFVERPSIIGEVSLGNPIVTLDDPKHTVTFDATESFARCPETTIDEYRIWDGDKLTNFGYAENEAVLAASATDVSDIFGAGSSIDTLRAPNGIKKASYGFNPMLSVTDEYHRWLPEQHLAMSQVKQSVAIAKSDTSGPNDTRATYQHSFLEHWVDESQSNNYGEDRAGIAEYNWPSDMTSSAFIAYKGPSDSDNWIDLNPFNRLVGEDLQHTLFHQTDENSHTDGVRRYGTLTSLDQAGGTGSYLVCARDSKWTKQHFQTKFGTRDGSDNSYRAGPITANTAANKTLNNEWTGLSHAGVRVEIFYTAQEDSSSNLSWKPLKYKDNTKHPYLDDSTFYSSGSIEWIEPDDWVECDPGAIPDRYWPGGDFENAADTFSYDSDASGNYFDVSNRWNATNKKYGLLWVITSDGAVSGAHSRFGYGPDVTYSFPASNNHSVLVDVVDPMHVSLNTHAISQSISYRHQGRYQIIEDRMGKSEIRKIGASGGEITFGGVDLKDQDATHTRDKFYEYQKRAVPVYLDVTHQSGNISRFFGVITSMSEDHPVGKQYGKFAVNMQVSHMITMNSSGTITSDGYISLGGDMVDDYKYV